MEKVAPAPKRETPLRATIRAELHRALDDLLDADEFDDAQAATVDAAFVRLLQLGRYARSVAGRLRR